MDHLSSYNILGIDPATSTGYCIITINKDVNIPNKEKIANIIKYGYFDIDTSSIYEGNWCIDLQNKIKNIIDEYKINEVAIEDYYFNKKSRNGANINVAYRTSIHILCCQMNIPYDIISISQWKNFIARRSTPTKEQKNKYGKAHSKKLFIQEALYNEFGIIFPNHSISHKTGKPIGFRSDIVDVIGISIFYCNYKHKIEKENIKMLVERPNDYIFKTKPKCYFDYSLLI
jgi:Holliday junction resolvasome RuvABC endonuclease subunit